MLSVANCKSSQSVPLNWLLSTMGLFDLLFPVSFVYLLVNFYVVFLLVFVSLLDYYVVLLLVLVFWLLFLSMVLVDY